MFFSIFFFNFNKFMQLKRSKLCQNSYKILVSVMPKLCQNAKTVLAVLAVLAFRCFGSFGTMYRVSTFGIGPNEFRQATLALLN
jgi:hypothetical protein